MPSGLDAGMAALRRGYADKLRVTLAGLRVDWEMWCDGEVEGGLRLRQSAHRLYGSGATFGFEDLSEAAGALEACLDAALAPATRPMVRQEIEPALARLLQVGGAIIDNPA